MGIGNGVLDACYISPASCAFTQQKGTALSSPPSVSQPSLHAKDMKNN